LRKVLILYRGGSNMTKQEFLKDKFFSCALYPSLPLTPASLLYKEKKLLNFCSRDYLGLSQHAEMRKAAIKYVLHYGTGICDPEIKNGFLECCVRIEEKCAEAVGFASAQLSATHSLALSGILQHFSPHDCVVCIDAGCQATLIDAVRRWSGTFYLYPHGDLAALQALLYTSKKRHLVISESLFGSTGHITDISILAEITQKSDAFLLIDDSHSFGIKGKQGFGLALGHAGIDFIVCALDGASGASGAFAACCEEYFFKSRPKSREEALSFSSLGAIEAALELIPTFEGERMQLEQRSHWLRKQLKKSQIALIPSTSHLLAIACDTPVDAHDRFHALLEEDILAEITTVGDASYIVFHINSYHTPEELSALAYACEQIYQNAGK
jgi:8-amino-7-oxononanoate synthase